MASIADTQNQTTIDKANALISQAKSKSNNISNSIENSMNNMKNNIKSQTENLKTNVNSTYNTINSKYQSADKDGILSTILKVLFLVVVFCIILYVIKMLFDRHQSYYIDAPYLLDGTKDAKNAMMISTDPNTINHIPMLRSDEREGIEFTYSFWMLISNLKYKNGQEKHIFHKGDRNHNPNMGPAVFLDKHKNSMIIYMNTQNHIKNANHNKIEIENLPLRKWLHFAIVLKNTYIDVYVNGFLKYRHEFDIEETGLPRQNDGDFYINLDGGFEGYLSRLRYYNYAVDFTEIDYDVRTGPDGGACIDTSELPPYFDDNWWFS